MVFKIEDKIEVVTAPSRRQGTVKVKVGECETCLKADEVMKLAFALIKRVCGDVEEDDGEIVYRVVPTTGVSLTFEDVKKLSTLYGCMVHQKMEFDHVDVVDSEIAIYGMRDVI